MRYDYRYFYVPYLNVDSVLEGWSARGWRVHTIHQSGSMVSILMEFANE